MQVVMRQKPRRSFKCRQLVVSGADDMQPLGKQVLGILILVISISFSRDGLVGSRAVFSIAPIVV